MPVRRSRDAIDPDLVDEGIGARVGAPMRRGRRTSRCEPRPNRRRRLQPARDRVRALGPARQRVARTDSARRHGDDDDGEPGTSDGAHHRGARAGKMEEAVWRSRSATPRRTRACFPRRIAGGTGLATGGSAAIHARPRRRNTSTISTSTGRCWSGVGLHGARELVLQAGVEHGYRARRARRSRRSRTVTTGRAPRVGNTGRIPRSTVTAIKRIRSEARASNHA